MIFSIFSIYIYIYIIKNSLEVNKGEINKIKCNTINITLNYGKHLKHYASLGSGF